MTSRVSFYKVLLQDLRHRLWMIVLSCLGSFMAMPVFYLLESKNWNNNSKDRSDMVCSVDNESHDHSTENYDRRAQKQAKEHINAVLDLINVARHSGDQGWRAERVKFGVRKRLCVRK